MSSSLGFLFLFGLIFVMWLGMFLYCTIRDMVRAGKRQGSLRAVESMTYSACLGESLIDGRDIDLRREDAAHYGASLKEIDEAATMGRARAAIEVIEKDKTMSEETDEHVIEEAVKFLEVCAAHIPSSPKTSTEILRLAKALSNIQTGSKLCQCSPTIQKDKP